MHKLLQPAAAHISAVFNVLFVVYGETVNEEVGRKKIRFSQLNPETENQESSISPAFAYLSTLGKQD